MTLPLSKTLHPDDYQALAAEVAFVEAFGGEALAQQHPHRRWEYALALRAFLTWTQGQPPASLARPWRVLDVGGAGSPLASLLHRGLVEAAVCDPGVNTPIEAAPYPDATFDAVFAISVIEHVPEVPPFLAACTRVLAPKGLLFLTADYWDTPGPDTAHFHWMRERIYSQPSWDRLSRALRDLGLTRFDGVDPIYHGDQLFGSYTFCSLCFTKESP